jgi:hypothetical protein
MPHSPEYTSYETWREGFTDSGSLEVLGCYVTSTFAYYAFAALLTAGAGLEARIVQGWTALMRTAAGNSNYIDAGSMPRVRTIESNRRTCALAIFSRVRNSRFGDFAGGRTEQSAT